MIVARLWDMFGPPPWPEHVHQDMDAIFWETAGRPPRDEAARETFKQRWLTSYLALDPQDAFVALDETTTPPRVTGYLVGTLKTPLQSERFGRDALFRAFAPLLDAFPAHLHINLVEAARGFGVGRRLIETFCAHAMGHGAPGVHVITSAEARNVAFYYGRVGFVERGRTTVDGRDIVLLGRYLDPVSSPEPK
jgi:GNAT superfamily N-acetyltransferase